MIKINDNSRYNKSYIDLRPLGVLAVAVYGYVEGFELTKQTCFASREHIAKELYSSPSLVGRAIAKLVSAKLLTRDYQGKNRILKTVKTSVNMTDISTTSVKKGGNLGQYDRRTSVNMTDYIELDLYKNRYIDPFMNKNINNNINTPELDQAAVERINGAAEKFKLKKRF
jgi:hypothetical protein